MRNTEIAPYAVLAMAIIVIAGAVIIFAAASRAGIIEEQPPPTTREINADKIVGEFAFN